jgi:predicted dehydrogenase
VNEKQRGNMKLKVAVVGVGHLGAIHTKLLANNNLAELIGIYDIDIEKAKEIAKLYSTQAFESLDEALKFSDAVIIATPTTTHFDIAKFFLENGKHCFIEKPITDSYQKALSLIAIAEQKRVIIQVGHVERFNPALKAVMRYNPKPLFIEAHRLSQFKARAIDVSVVSDLMIHDIDIVIWLVKSPVKNIYANGVPVLTETIDIANARIEFENGAIANLTASRISAKPTRKMRIFQKQAYFSIDFGNQKVEVFRLTDKSDSTSAGTPAMMLGNIFDSPRDVQIFYETPNVEPTNAIEEEHKSFFEAILFGKPIPVSAFEASQALKITELVESKIKESLNLIY